MDGEKFDMGDTVSVYPKKKKGFILRRLSSIRSYHDYNRVEHYYIKYSYILDWKYLEVEQPKLITTRMVLIEKVNKVFSDF